VDEDHGVVGEGRVEFLLARSPPFGEQFRVVAEAHHELPGTELPPRLHPLQGGDHVGHGRARAGRRRRTERLRLHVDEREEVAVAVDEAGHERPAAEVRDHGRVALVPEHVGLGAHGHDPPAGDRDRLRGGLGRVHGDDRAAADDPVGRSGGGEADGGEGGDHRRDRRGGQTSRHGELLGNCAGCRTRSGRV